MLNVKNYLIKFLFCTISSTYKCAIKITFKFANKMINLKLTFNINKNRILARK